VRPRATNRKSIHFLLGFGRDRDRMPVLVISSTFAAAAGLLPIATSPTQSDTLFSFFTMPLPVLCRSLQPKGEAGGS